MATRTLARDDFVWRRGMTSNVGASSLINPKGWMVAHVWRGNDGTGSACEDDGSVIVAHVTKSEAFRAADAVMRPCAWVDPHPSLGVVGCDDERAAGSIYCAVHTTTAAALDVRKA